MYQYLLFYNLPITPVLFKYQIKLRYLRCLCLIYHKSDFIPFFLLIAHNRKEKALSRALPPLVVLCTLYWAFCLLYLSYKRCLICPYGKEIQQAPQGQSLATYHTAYATPYVLHKAGKQEHEPKRFTVYHGAFKH